MTVVAICWLSLFCQHCLAYAQPLVGAGQPDHTSHCQPEALDSDDTGTARLSCSAACDSCVIASAATVVPNQIVPASFNWDDAVVWRSSPGPEEAAGPGVVRTGVPDIPHQPLRERFCTRLE
jgi:hypothetical protein